MQHPAGVWWDAAERRPRPIARPLRPDVDDDRERRKDERPERQRQTSDPKKARPPWVDDTDGDGR